MLSPISVHNTLTVFLDINRHFIAQLNVCFTDISVGGVVIRLRYAEQSNECSIPGWATDLPLVSRNLSTQ